jgi:hypothetical protein
VFAIVAFVLRVKRLCVQTLLNAIEKKELLFCSWVLHVLGRALFVELVFQKLLHSLMQWSLKE